MDVPTSEISLDRSLVTITDSDCTKQANLLVNEITVELNQKLFSEVEIIVVAGMLYWTVSY